MNRLKIVAIYDRGVANQERLHISTLVEANLSFYVVLASTYGPNRQTVMAGSRFAYWFNPYIVKPGDWIVLYTGAGPYTAERRSDGGTNHFFHWGLPHTLWSNPDSCAILFEINTWETK